MTEEGEDETSANPLSIEFLSASCTFPVHRSVLFAYAVVRHYAVQSCSVSVNAWCVQSVSTSLDLSKDASQFCISSVRVYG